jgi:hypothetical protein
VLIISADIAPYQETCERLGFAYIGKPFSMSVLHQLVQSLIEKEVAG